MRFAFPNVIVNSVVLAVWCSMKWPYPSVHNNARPVWGMFCYFWFSPIINNAVKNTL